MRAWRIRVVSAPSMRRNSTIGRGWLVTRRTVFGSSRTKRYQSSVPLVMSTPSYELASIVQVHVGPLLGMVFGP